MVTIFSLLMGFEINRFVKRTKFARGSQIVDIAWMILKRSAHEQYIGFYAVDYSNLVHVLILLLLSTSLPFSAHTFLPLSLVASLCKVLALESSSIYRSLSPVALTCSNHYAFLLAFYFTFCRCSHYYVPFLFLITVFPSGWLSFDPAVIDNYTCETLRD